MNPADFLAQAEREAGSTADPRHVALRAVELALTHKTNYTELLARALLNARPSPPPC